MKNYNSLAGENVFTPGVFCICNTSITRSPVFTTKRKKKTSFLANFFFSKKFCFHFLWRFYKATLFHSKRKFSSYKSLSIPQLWIFLQLVLLNINYFFCASTNQRKNGRKANKKNGKKKITCLGIIFIHAEFTN